MGLNLLDAFIQNDENSFPSARADIVESLCPMPGYFKDIWGYCKQCHEIFAWAETGCCASLFSDNDGTYDDCCFVPYDDTLKFKPTMVEGNNAQIDEEDWMELSDLVCSPVCGD